MEIFQKAEDLCKIINTCRKAGVAHFKLGELVVCFYTPDAREARVTAPEPNVAPTPVASPTPEAQVPEETIRAAERIEAESIEAQGIQTREEQIAELILTDPLLAEQMMEQGDLTDLAGEPKDGSGDDDGE